MTQHTIRIPPPGAPAPRAPGVTRAYGQATVLARQGGLGLVPAAAATVTPYVAGTVTPYTAPLYAAAADTAPVVFPLLTGDDGVVALWSDTPVRLDLVASAPGLGQAGVPLDLELPPGAVDPASPYLTQDEGDARYPLKTDPNPYPGYLTPAEGDAAYLPIGYTPPPVDLSGYYTKAQADPKFVDVAGDTMTGALSVAAPLFVAGADATFYRGDTSVALHLQSRAGARKSLWLEDYSGQPRWAVASMENAETGSNAGSDFNINRYADAGAFLGTPLSLSRATGAATFGGDVSIGNADATLSRAAASDLRLNAHFSPATTFAWQLGTTALRWANVFSNAFTASAAVAIGAPTAASGMVRLPNAQNVAWRNAAGSGDLSLGMNASDQPALAVGAGALTTSATVGTASALPGVPAGYLTVVLNGTARKVAYWNP